MNFFFDESSDAPIAEELRRRGHTVRCAWELSAGSSDEAILNIANEEQAILVTGDKDFGELVFRLGRAHHGVMLLRLAGQPMSRKVAIVVSAIDDHGAEFRDAFTVIAPRLIRIRR